MFDSDTVLLTDNEVMVRCASYYYNTFKVPTMVVDSKKKKRRYTDSDKADLDIFCNSDRIGIIVNLSQEINTIMWDRINRNGDWESAKRAYYDNCLLSILSSIAIDSSKKEYDIDCDKEFDLVRARYNDRDEIGRAIRPYFFAHVAKKKGYYDPKKKNYKRHMAPMDYLQGVVDSRKHSGYNRFKITKKISDIIKVVDADQKPREGYVDLVLSMVRDMDSKTRMLYQIKDDASLTGDEKRKLVGLYYENCVNGIRNMHLNDATLKELLDEIDNPENSTIRRKLWSILFYSFGEELASMLKKNSASVYSLEECKAGEVGDVQLFSLQFRKISVT